MSEFKQIIGRGTRVRDDYGKLWFNIIDYTGSRHAHVRRPGLRRRPGPASPRRRSNADGQATRSSPRTARTGSRRPRARARRSSSRPPEEPRKFYFDGGQVEIAAHLVYELDPNGKQLRVVRYTDYAAEKVRTLCPTAPELRAQWADPEQRAAIIAAPGRARHQLRRAGRGRRASPTPTPSTCSATSPSTRPLRTRRERAQRLQAGPQGLLRALRPRGPRTSWRSCWKSTPSTATPSSCCPTC